MTDAEAGITLFRRDGAQFVPTPFTTGPWRSDAMHGGPPSALIGTVVEDVMDEGEQVAGIQIDLQRAVPIEPLTVVVERRPQSRRISYLSVEIHAASGRAVAAKALLLRGEPIETIPDQDDAPIPPDQVEPMTWADRGHWETPVFHMDAVEHRVVEGGFGVPGPSVAWLRPRGSVIAGESPSGLAQLLAVADFGSALSQSVAPGSSVSLINVDVNVSLTRSPVGPWFCLEARGIVSNEGIGLAVARLRDIGGPLGIVTLSQIAYARPGTAPRR
jgi:Thioesterase-like superfamily